MSCCIANQNHSQLLQGVQVDEKNELVSKRIKVQTIGPFAVNQDDIEFKVAKLQS